jgi:hypothetical protein
MRYMLLVCRDEKTGVDLPRAEMEALVQGHMRFGEELRAKGKMVATERLRREDEASRIRLKGGQRHVLDGPFAETKETVGGFYLIECDSKDEAIAWAKKIPLREGGFVEVRAIWEM